MQSTVGPHTCSRCRISACFCSKECKLSLKLDFSACSCDMSSILESQAESPLKGKDIQIVHGTAAREPEAAHLFSKLTLSSASELALTASASSFSFIVYSSSSWRAFNCLIFAARALYCFSMYGLAWQKMQSHNWLINRRGLHTYYPFFIDYCFSHSSLKF